MSDVGDKIANDGYSVVCGVLSIPEVQEIGHRLDRIAVSGAGDRRLLQHSWCRAMLCAVQERLVASGFFLDDLRPVMCTFFNKTHESNWGVAPHQDSFIPVSGRFKKEGWEKWSVKQGIPHVRPPRAVLESLLAVRLHIDSCGSSDGPLEVLPGSHRRNGEGRPSVTCVVQRGDAIIMRPLLMHSSSKSHSGRSRRVLHALFGPEVLPPPAKWYQYAA